MTVHPAYGDPAPQPVVPSDDELAERRRAFVQDLLTNLSLITTWFAAAGVLGALVWVQVTPLPGFTRIGNSGSMDEEQLARQFASNGWFLVIAAVAGLLSGIVLLLLRRRSHPSVVVGLVALGGGLATLVMVRCGLAWGPDDPNVALSKAKLGEVVPIQLKVDAHGVYFAWSVAALVGAMISLWWLDSREKQRAQAQGDAQADFERLFPE